MKKEEYMSGLKKALEGFEEELVQEIVTDYEEHFRVGLERGRSEEELIEELGTAEDLVEEINEMLGIRSQGASGQNLKAEPRQAEKMLVRSTEADAEGQNDNVTEENSSWKGYEQKEEEQSWGQEDRDKISKSIKDMLAKAMEEAGKAIDIAAKEVGKIDFDKIMKEAGDAINEAGQAMQEGFKKQKEVWKQRGNTENTTWEQNESSDSQNEEKEYNQEQGEEGCKRIIIQGEFADVTLKGTDDTLPSATYEQSSYKDSMIYPFYSYQEGDTFYIGFRKSDENTERKSGFFRMKYSSSADLTVNIPKGVECVELTGTSGDIEIEGLSAGQLIISSKSGDIEMCNIHGRYCKIESISGDITLRHIQNEEFLLSSKSGDVEIERMQGGKLQLSTMSGDLNITSSSFEELTGSLTSGDAEADNVKAKSISISTASGDICMQNVKAEKQKMGSKNGDIEVDNCAGGQMEVSVSFGDIHISAEYEAFRLRGNSGDIDLCSCKDADVEAESSFGDINIEMRNVQSFYKVIANSSFGETSVSKQKNHDGNAAVRTITAKTNSGDVHVDFY